MHDDIDIPVLTWGDVVLIIILGAILTAISANFSSAVGAPSPSEATPPIHITNAWCDRGGHVMKIEIRATAPGTVVYGWDNAAVCNPPGTPA